MNIEGDSIGLKSVILQDFFINKYSTQSQDITKNLLILIRSDNDLKYMLKKEFNTFFQSRHKNLYRYFEACLRLPQFKQQIQNFLASFIKQKIKNLERQLQAYILKHIWKEPLRFFWSQSQIINMEDIVIFLCMKMRSLDHNARKIALNSFYLYAKEYLLYDRHNQKTDVKEKLMLQKLLPITIQKQVLVKKVSHPRGIFLQLLQDEYQEIRVLCLQILAKLYKFFEMNELKPVILYMINDEHELVRQKTVQAIKEIPPMVLNSEDLTTILMCLKESNILLRKSVYKVLAHSHLDTIQNFYLMLQKLMSQLTIRKTDKKQIYKTFAILGKKYQSFLITMSHKPQLYNKGILPLDQQQPSWKNIQQKAKIILLGNTSEKLWHNQIALPEYFKRQYLFVKDIQGYCFSKDENKINESKMNWDEINLSNLNNIMKYLSSEKILSEGFKKQIIEVLQKIVYSFFEMEKLEIIKTTLLKLKYLYKIDTYPIADQIINETMRLVTDNFTSEQSQIIKTLQKIAKQIYQIPGNIQKNVFKLSKHDPKVILTSKSKQFISCCFIRCVFNNKSQQFIRLNCLQPMFEDEKFYYYEIHVPGLFVGNGKMECLIKEIC